ncbi:MAG: hypothetical protein WCV63_10745 [Negativicutes bacterium]|jgi:zinc protease
MKNVKLNGLLLIGFIFCIFCYLPVAQAETRPSFNYAIAINSETAKDKNWFEVADVLSAKYPITKIFVYDNLNDLTGPLTAFSPDYIAYVCKPQQATPEFVKAASKLNRELENKPYGTAVWGIVTGYDYEDALRIARESKPVSINFGLGGMFGFIDALPEGVAYLEFYDQRNKWQEKKKGKNVQERDDAPDDHLLPMINLINSNKVDGIWTSGHGLADSWLTYFPDGPAQIVAVEGKLYGEINGEQKETIDSSNPKIYLGIGNCLTARIDDIDKAYSLSWIHSGGVDQYFGYTVETYYGMMGWGMADNFFYRGGSYNVAESMFVANQALLLAIDQKLVTDELKDMEYDRDVCVVYGDPAWMAKVPSAIAKAAAHWNCQLDRQIVGDKIQWELTVRFNKDIDFSGVSGKDIRPVFMFLPEKIKKASAEVDLSNIAAYHIAKNFVIVQFAGQVAACETRKFSFVSEN